MNFFLYMWISGFLNVGEIYSGLILILEGRLGDFLGIFINLVYSVKK